MSDEINSMSNLPTGGYSNTEAKMLGKYKLLHKLGQGGMGEVWLAEDTIAEIKVAIKFLPQLLRDNHEEQERLKSSFKLVAQLQHPNICGLRDLQFIPEVGFFLVMEYFPGITIHQFRSQIVKSRGKFTFNQLTKVLMPIAEALDYAHSKRIVHRDIKPANILISSDFNEIRVIDFQLAGEIRSSLARISNQKTDMSGTYPYMAPEQFLGGRANAKTDLYSLAMVAYQLYSGDLPFDTVSFEHWQSLITNEKIDIGQFSDSQDPNFQLIKKGLARNPLDRPESCVEYVQYLSSPNKIIKKPEKGSSNEDSDKQLDKKRKTYLKITRKMQYSGAAGYFAIFLDKERKGVIWVGGELRIEVTPGLHYLEFKTGINLTTGVEIDVPEQGTLHVVSGVNFWGTKIVIESPDGKVLS